MSDNFKSNLHEDVMAHEIYKGLTADLNDDQREAIEKTLREFTKLIETGMLKPYYDMTEKVRDEVAQELVDEAVDKIKKKREPEADAE